MKPEDRSRFLIALAKYLGVQPLPADPLSSIRLSEEWHLDECLRLVIVDSGRVLLPIARFNELMLHCGRPLVSAWFFEYFFRNIGTIDQFEASVERFRMAAMWLYGNFKFAHRALGTCSEEEFTRLIQQTEPRLPEAHRQAFTEIEDIQDDELPMLGYISSGRVKAIAGIITEVERMVADPAHALDIWRGLGPVATKFGEALRAFGFRLEIVDGVLASTPPELPALLVALKEREPQLMAKLTGAQEKGRRNTHRYLTLPYLDVYVATSMRSDEDFIEQHRFVKQVFEDPELAPLRLRYFDPTLSWVKSRITKGLVEALMLRRAKVTIYNAGERETLGKDSELAATLAQGKPVIVYVREGTAYDARADNYRADHPLGLQIALSTGVAHGIIVVRTAAQCARLLRRVLLGELPLEIRHEEGNYQLVEHETQSVLRVVSDDPLLTHSFWAFFRVNSDV